MKMKKCIENSKKWRGLLCLTVVFGFFLGVYFVSFGTDVKRLTTVLAEEDDDDSDDSADSTTQSIAQMKESLDSIKVSTTQTKDLLTNLEYYKNDVIAYMEKLDSDLADLEDDLINMRQQQEGVQDNLELVQQQLDVDQRTEQQQYASMKLRIRYLYEHGSYTFLDALAGSTSLGDMLNRSNAASMIQSYDNRLLNEYRESLAAISEKESYISSAKAKLDDITNSLLEERQNINEVIEQKSNELVSYNQNIEIANKLIKSYESSEKEIENQLQAAEYDYLNDDDEMYASLPSAYSGGKFLWPAPGHYQITSKFGYRIHPLTGTRRLHAGIDIAVPTGSGIYAGADGVVAVATYSSSAGNYVMINHGGGLCTVYMHNSKLLVSAGDKVKRGQKIALSGSTGWSTGPHCHFGVRVNGQYVNPIPYLKSTSNSDDTDYSDSEVPDTSEDSIKDTTSNDDVSSDNATITKDDDADTSAYTTEADDVGDNGNKSSDLKDDSDPDSE